MTTMTANAKAFELAHKLFDLIGQFKELSIRSANAEGEAGFQADAVACELARVYDSISGPSPLYDLFIDAARDPQDQSFAFPV